MPGRGMGRRAGRRAARRTVRRHDAFRNQGVSEPMGQEVPTKETGMTSELEEIANLKTKGLITEEEYEAKRKQILGL